ncbi:uncharacterized protein JCM10292_006720 [Rhodotorula paludigena]|uniref:uncharacterized protein n=1 Tax=Rhodotorula paludigena TaxID=86838 RepID=UPI003179DE01
MSVKRKNPRLCKTTIDGGFDWTFSFDIDDLDLTDPNLETDLSFDSPLVGRWAILIRRQEDKLTIQIDHGTLTIGRLGKRARATLSLGWSTHGRHTQLACVHFEEEPLPSGVEKDPHAVYTGLILAVPQRDIERAEKASQGAFVASSHRRYSFEVRFEQDTLAPTKFSDDLASRTPDSTRSPIPHDVRFFFPHAGQDGAEIWTTAELLSNSSPYLKDLLSSDFAESVTVSSRKRQRRSITMIRSTGASYESAKDHDDSDDELDELFFDRFPRPLFDVEQTPELAYRQIEVKLTAYTTYLAVIRWLETGYIAFLPLTSTCKPTDTSATRTHREELMDSIHEQDGSVKHGKKSLRVSLKSTYRLAHLLQLDRLQQLCLTQLPLSLTHHGAAHELFETASVLYKEWRKVILDYVVENWDEVTTTGAWTENEARIDSDELRGAAPILQELLKAKMKQTVTKS